jgi:hypothetical protein
MSALVAPHLAAARPQHIPLVPEILSTSQGVSSLTRKQVIVILRESFTKLIDYPTPHDIEDGTIVESDDRVMGFSNPKAMTPSSMPLPVLICRFIEEIKSGFAVPFHKWVSVMGLSSYAKPIGLFDDRHKRHCREPCCGENAIQVNSARCPSEPTG